MVQKKYTPEESLQRVKLMMKYDSSKTLNENKSNIFVSLNEDKDSTPSNSVTDEDLMGQTGALQNWVQMVGGSYNIFDIIGLRPADLIGGRRKGVKGVVDALDGFVDMKDLAYVSLLLKGLEGKCYYDDVDGKNKSATERFLELYSEDEGGDDMKSDIESVGTTTLKTGAEKIKKQLLKQIETNIAKGCSSKKTDDGDKVVTPRVSKYKPCSGTYKEGCEASAVGKVQGCLGGLSVDNKFGPKTASKLVEKGFKSTFTDSDVEKICKGKEDKPEISSELNQINVADL